ncbi:hypothetical protein FPOA_08914 [Fusarium poae]|uniref:C2H2-type domain-containing protein n=1 Tax=Fusarium poae TaxID=36050 RepID=A0A1B8APZ1_FUSPO|nr:hypothetical protein FPOA_08914 [Fusarium poae]
MGEESIPDYVRICLDGFETIRMADVSGTSTSDQKAALGIGEEEARFKIWSGNVAAHSTGRRSLQYRLRDASHLQKQVKSLLNELGELLADAFLIVSGVKLPWDRIEDEENVSLDIGSDSDSDFDEMPDTEMAQIAQNVSDVINCLLRLSVAIRNPAPHDRFAASVPVEASHYEPFDIQHVKDKFGVIEPFLADRLGKAISRRRQYFKYRESHHLKLKQGLDSLEQNDAESTVASSLPLHAKAAGFNLEAMNEDGASESGFTQTSLASSKPDSEKLRVPPIPREAEDGPFECPFCYMMITASSTVSWKRHVLADLRPYVCLWEDCTASGMEFMRRHEWTMHETQNHLKTYHCPCSCGKTFSVRSKCQSHVRKAHPDAFSSSQLDAMIDLSAKPTREDESVSCPMCKETLSSVKDYQRHVGRHQEQLALFALPSLQTDDDAQIEEDASGTHSQVSSEDLDVPYEELRKEKPPKPQPPEPPISNKSTSGPLKELDDLAVEFQLKWMPFCANYIQSPPSNPKEKEADHRTISDSVITHILLKLDGIETQGNPDARLRRKELVQQVQRALKNMDDVRAM